MSTTIIDNLFSPGDTTPASPWIEAVGGKRADNGKIAPLLLDHLGQVNVVPGRGTADAFDRLRVSAPYGLLDTKQVFDADPLRMDTTLVGGGTAPYSANNAATSMQVTTANLDSVVRQTKQYAPYQPGRSQLAFATGVMGVIKTNVRQRIGYFDANNGLFFEQNGTTLRVVRRTKTSGAPVDNTVDQASWNIDTFDGTGSAANPSGVLLDTSKIQVFVVDFSWLGAGGGRLGFLLTNASGVSRIYYCHAFAAANTLTLVYMGTGSLPLRWELTNTGVTASATTMLQICGTVMSESGFDPAGLVVTAAIDSTTGRTVASGTSVPLISVRLKSAYNRGTLIPKEFDSMSTSNQSWLAQFVIGGTLTGASWNATSGQATEFDVAATAISGGTKIASSYASANGARTTGNALESALIAASNIAGTSDIVTLVVIALTGNVTAWGSITWREVY